MPKTSIVVTIADDKLSNIDQVADKLAAKGMEISRVLPITGVITGSCAVGKFPALENVEGVMSVEEEAVARLPPMGSSPQ